MEYNKVNYQVIEEALLAAESKDYIQQVFETVATNTLDSEIYTMKSENLPQSLKAIPKTLNISNDKALVVNYFSAFSFLFSSSFHFTT